MTTTPFHVFIDFVQCEDQLGALGREKERAERDLKALAHAQQAQQKALEQLNNKRDELQKSITQHEKEVASSRQKKGETERKMDRITNPRELASLQHELTELEQFIEKTETAIVQLWEDLEAEQKNVATAGHELQENIKKSEEQEKVITDRLQQLHEALITHKKTCDEKSLQVKSDWLEKYRSLKTQTNNPVVAVVNGACTGCFSKIPPQIIARVERHELVPCPFCRRLLYHL